MNKEQRAEPRRPLSHQFYVYHADTGKEAYMTRDLSLNGVFVEGDFARFPVGSDVVVSFMLPALFPGAHSEKEYIIEAIVARVTYEGAGLRFLNPDMETCNALLKLRDSV